MMTRRMLVLALFIPVLASLSPLMAGPYPGEPNVPVLQTYTLPAGSACDGKLAKWRGVLPADPALFKFIGTNKHLVPSADFAPYLYCGRVAGGKDLFFLLLVKDRQLWTDETGPWALPDCADLYLDFGRSARTAKDPNWFKLNPANPPAIGQVEVSPRTLVSAGKVYPTMALKKWKIDAVNVPVEGGIAYEFRIDGNSVLADLGEANLPAYMGLDVGVWDLDDPVFIQVAGWENTGGNYRLNGDYMSHSQTAKYAVLNLEPAAADANAPALPRTLPELYGPKPTAGDVAKALGLLGDEKLGDLIHWAGLQGMTPDEELVKRILAAGGPRAKELCLAVLYARCQDKETVRLAVEAVYRDAETAAAKTDGDESKTQPAAGPRVTGHALVLANLLCQKFELDVHEPLQSMLRHEDLGVFITACNALAAVGDASDLAAMEKARGDLLPEAAQTAATGPATAPVAATNAPAVKDANVIQRRAVYAMQFHQSIEELSARVNPPPVPQAVAHRQIEPKNADLPRHLPSDNNKVYGASGLCRTWPKDGPPLLWRAEVGKGLSTAIEAGGRTYVAGTIDGNFAALCLSAATGQCLWQRPLGDKAKDPTVTPVADGERVYFVSSCVTCLDARDGNVVWEEKTAYRPTGYSSPLVMGDVLYIGCSQPGALVAADKATGKLLWSTPAGMGSSPASPCYQEIDGIGQIVLGAIKGSSAEIWGVNAKTGEIFWRRPFNGRWGACASPIAAGSRIFLCAGHSPDFSECIQTYVEAGRIQARLLYHREKIQTNSHNTPAIMDGAVYGFGPTLLECTRLSDGKILWSQPWSGDRHLLLAEGVLLISTEKGEIVMAQASQGGYQEMGRFDTGVNLSGSTQQMTLANGRLYVRGGTQLACFDLLEKKTPERQP